VTISKPTSTAIEEVVEAALIKHPDLASCAVIGLPHPDLGSSIHAVLQRREGADDDAMLASMPARVGNAHNGIVLVPTRAAVAPACRNSKAEP
jgi:acyl-coenzyme A synthetase/AMP-(fatty) acid ligase